MGEPARPRVQLIAWTQFEPPDDVAWATDAEGGQALAEFAGRACYQSWSKPNPATATNATFLAHLLEVGHLSVLEHGTATLYLTGISRPVGHELTRHRHFSFSELSPRYPPDPSPVEPAVIAADPQLHALFVGATQAGQEAYEKLLAGLEERLAVPGESSVLAAKQARQAALAVLPNAVPTRIVMTGNYRSWRHFIGSRATEHADVELRTVALACLRQLRTAAPHVFADFTITTLRDGTEIAASPYALQS